MALVTEIYSASVVDNTITDCFLELHETAPLSIKHVKPEIECWCSCDTRSASEYTTRPFAALPKVSFTSQLPFKYLITRFSASQCVFPRLCMNCLRSETENAMSGHVPNVAYIREPTASLYGMFVISLILDGMLGHCVTDRVSPESIGVDTDRVLLRLKQEVMVSM